MSDVDILVREPEVDIVMDKISDLGYRISDEQWRSYRKTDHHHLPEARHPETGVSLEVHTGLFSPEEFYADEDVFQTDSIHGQCVDFDFEGFPAARLTPEFQFVFTVSKWSVDRDWAINLKNINDIVHLLRRHEATFDWPLRCHPGCVRSLPRPTARFRREP